MLTFVAGDDGELKAKLHKDTHKRVDRMEELAGVLARVEGPWQEPASEILGQLKNLRIALPKKEGPAAE